MTENSTRLFIFLLGALCGVLGTSFWNSSAPAGDVTTTPVTTTLPTGSTTTPPVIADTSGTVVVTDQWAGGVVTIDSVTVSPPGVWIAVHEMAAGKLGNVLGAAHARGPMKDLMVPLLRSTAPNQEYAVVLYRDDGDDQFSLGKDSVYVDFDTGAPVIAPFTTK